MKLERSTSKIGNRDVQSDIAVHRCRNRIGGRSVWKNVAELLRIHVVVCQRIGTQHVGSAFDCDSHLGSAIRCEAVHALNDAIPYDRTSG